MRNRVKDHVAIVGDSELWKVDLDTDYAEPLYRDGERCLCGRHLDSGEQCDRCSGTEPPRLDYMRFFGLVIVCGIFAAVALCVAEVVAGILR